MVAKHHQLGVEGLATQPVIEVSRLLLVAIPGCHLKGLREGYGGQVKGTR